MAILQLDAPRRAATLRAIEMTVKAESKFGCCFFACEAKTSETAKRD
jgi:hypothetical protein